MTTSSSGSLVSMSTPSDVMTTVCSNWADLHGSTTLAWSKTWFDCASQNHKNTLLYMDKSTASMQQPTFYHLQTRRSICPSVFWSPLTPPSIWALKSRGKRQHLSLWRPNGKSFEGNAPIVKDIPSSIVMSLSLAEDKWKKKNSWIKRPRIPQGKNCGFAHTKSEDQQTRTHHGARSQDDSESGSQFHVQWNKDTPGSHWPALSHCHRK